MAKKAEFNLATVKKYVFWAFIPIALLFPLLTTVMAVGSIADAFEKRKSALNSKKSSVESIKSKREHPNQETIDEIKRKTMEQRGRVREAWRILEKDQRERNLWPSEVGKEFLDEIRTLKWGEEISLEGLEKYLNFAQKYLPALEVYVERRRVQKRLKGDNGEWGEWQEIEDEKDIHSAVASPDGGMSLGGEGSGLGNMDATGSLEPPLPKSDEVEFRYHGKVDWESPETRTVVSSWGSLPKYTEVWYAQEELWVYRALLWVVKQSNADATGPHNATIKRIENLLIGQLASTALEAQSKNRIRFAGATGAAGGAISGGDPMMSGGMDGANTVVRTEADAEKIKRERRYVDEKGTPLGAAENSKFDQFKRMPICLRLIVDQRKIPEILVNCANCSMPIDVLWVRINPGAAKPFELDALDATTAGGASASAGGEMSASSSSDGAGYGDSGMDGGMRGPGGGGMSGDDIQIKLDGVGGPYGTNAVPVEIYGCINIFNPVEQATALAPEPELEKAPEPSNEESEDAPAESETETPEAARTEE